MKRAARHLGVSEVQAYVERNEKLRDALGIAPRATCEVRALARGEYHANYTFMHPETGAPLLVRINLGSQMHLENQIAYEAHALELLSACPRTPRVLFVDGSASFFDAGVLVEEYLPGRPLRYETDQREAAGILADIHSVVLPENHGLVAPEHPLADMVDECAQMFFIYRESALARPETLARLDRFFEIARISVRNEVACPLRHIVNTELNSRNFLINHDAPGYLIDWEKPLAAAVEQDIAHFLVPTTTLWKTDTVLDRGARRRFIETYCEAVDGRFDTGCVAAQVEPYLNITCLRGITWCAMALVDYDAQPAQTRDEYTYRKIKDYVSESFLAFVEREYFT
ncbi:MAG: phosphotransferase [Raoultibacter sp.]